MSSIKRDDKQYFPVGKYAEGISFVFHTSVYKFELKKKRYKELRKIKLFKEVRARAEGTARSTVVYILYRHTCFLAYIIIFVNKHMVAVCKVAQITGETSLTVQINFYCVFRENLDAMQKTQNDRIIKAGSYPIFVCHRHVCTRATFRSPHFT